MNDVQRRVVVVTGAGTGIGRATARGFSADGAQVLAVGRRSAPLADTATGHPLIAPLAVDVTAADAPRRVVDAALDRYGRLDVLVNNAGIAGAGPLAELDEAATHAQFATNLLAPARLAHAALGALTVSCGVIVNVTTAVGQRAWPGASMYAAGKAALDSLTRSWAVELAPRGIRVVAVAPGAIDTPIGEHQGLSLNSARHCGAGNSTVRRWAASELPRRWPGPSGDSVNRRRASSPGWCCRSTAGRSSADRPSRSSAAQLSNQTTSRTLSPPCRSARSRMMSKSARNCGSTRNTSAGRSRSTRHIRSSARHCVPSG